MKPTMSLAFTPRMPHQRQHPERIDQVWQRLRRIVDLDRPAEMNVKVVRRLHDVGGLDNPFAAARWDEEIRGWPNKFP